MRTADLLVTTYDQMLGMLSGLLAKAAEQAAGDALLRARLAEDMFPLAAQVRFLCNMPGEHLARLAGGSFESRDDDDATIAAAQARIAATREWLGAFDRDTLKADDAAADFTLGNGMRFALNVEQYARDWALSQFYFHLMIVYSILRREGLAIGKADYVPFMGRYLALPASA